MGKNNDALINQEEHIPKNRKTKSNTKKSKKIAQIFEQIEKPQMTKHSIYINAEILEIAKEKAKGNDVSLNKYIEKAIEYLNENI